MASDPLHVIFDRIITLCEELEDHTPLTPRMRHRLCNAFERAIEKTCVLAWYELADTDTDRTNRTIFRHAERGARDYVP